MEFAQPENVGRGFLGVVEAVVGFGQALIVADHERGAELVILPSRRLQRRVRLEGFRKRECLETVTRCVALSVFERRAEKACPKFVGA